MISTTSRRRRRRTSRRSLAGSIEALIDMLDDLSPDPDLEDDEIEGDDERERDDADDEPTLGARENHPRPCGPFAARHRSPQGGQGGWFRGSTAGGRGWSLPWAR